MAVIENLVKNWVQSRIGANRVTTRLDDAIANMRMLEEKLSRRDEEITFTNDLLVLLNAEGNSNGKLHKIVDKVRDFTGFEAVGVRVRDGNDFPYYYSVGFGAEFVASENKLCGDKGKLSCLCGAVLEANTDASLGFFTEGGSFWTTHVSKLVKTLSEQVKALGFTTRQRCYKEGYETVILVPLRSGDDIVGLLQLNDRREDFATEEDVAFFEQLGRMIGIAMRRMLTERKLAESEAHYRNMLNSLPSVTYRISRDGELLNVYGPPRLLWRDPSQIVGRKIGDLVPKKFGRYVTRKIKEALAAPPGEYVTFTYTIEINGVEADRQCTLGHYGDVADQVLAVVTDISRTASYEEQEDVADG